VSETAIAAPAQATVPTRLAYIGMGGNLGDARETLQAALETLTSLERSRLVAVSPYYRSAPLQAEGADFTNAVAVLDTSLEPFALLLHLNDIEKMLGRRRRAGDAPHSAARPIDLDLLMVGSLIIRSTPLILPHPRMHERAFVLRPLLDLDAGAVIPGHGAAAALLDRVSGQVIERLA
jgi:2-amino-4-hydroxy-6-hydroxymethyldihydropteridine diphosphokinase